MATREARTVLRGGSVRTRVGTDGLDEAGVQREFAASERFVADLIGGGTEAWNARYRWVGPVKVMAYKEVGPPPWRWPRIGIQPHGWRFVRFIVGWRSTAYALCIMWAGRRHAAS